MAMFCGACGTPRSAGKFCGSCGQPYGEEAQPAPQAQAAPGAPSNDPAPAQASVGSPPAPPRTYEVPAPPPESVQWSPPPAARPSAPVPPTTPANDPWGAPADPWGAAAPAAAPRQPSSIRNPFLGVPISDYVRDAGAALLLLTGLGLTWDAENGGGDHWYVVLALLVSLASLAVPYVVSAGVVPGIGMTESSLLKIGLNLPVLVVVLVTLVNEVVSFGEPLEGGVGVGVGLALAGALLAAQPRASEVDVAAGARVWWPVGLGLAVASVAVPTLGFVAHLVDDVTGVGYLFDEPLFLVAETVAFPVLLLALLGIPLMGMINGAQSWRRVYVAAGLGFAGSLAVTQANEADSFVFWLGVEKWNSPTFGSFLVAGAAAVAAGHVAARRLAARSTLHPAQEWARTAGQACVVAAVVLGISVLGVVLSMVADDDLQAAGVVVAVMLGVAAGLCGACVPMTHDPRRSRPLALALLAGVLVLGLIVASVVRAQEVSAVPVFLPGEFFSVFGMGGVGVFAPAIAATTCTALFVLPVLAIVALTGPKSIRETLGPVYTPRVVQPDAAGHTAYPGQPAAPAPHPGQPG